MGPVMISRDKFPPFLPLPVALGPFLVVFFCLFVALMPRYPRRGRTNFFISRTAAAGDFRFVDNPAGEVAQLRLRCAILSHILYWKTHVLAHQLFRLHRCGRLGGVGDRLLRALNVEFESGWRHGDVRSWAENRARRDRGASSAGSTWRKARVGEDCRTFSSMFRSTIIAKGRLVDEMSNPIRRYHDVSHPELLWRRHRLYGGAPAWRTPPSTH